GLAAMFLFLFPLLLLPGRLYSVYWYLPLTGLAIALATIADGRYRIVIAVLFLIWILWDFRHFREQRRAAQRMEWQYRTYVTSLQNYARSAPGQRLFVWDNVPEGFHHWGVGGAVSCVFRAQAVQVYQIDAPGALGPCSRPAFCSSLSGRAAGCFALVSADGGKYAGDTIGRGLVLARSKLSLDAAEGVRHAAQAGIRQGIRIGG